MEGGSEGFQETSQCVTKETVKAKVSRSLSGSKKSEKSHNIFSYGTEECGISESCTMEKSSERETGIIKGK